MVFELAGENYGVNIAVVESIIKLQTITAIPQVSSFLEGITNLRGYVLPVIDLRKRLELTPREFTKNSRIIVISLNQSKVGMIVDSVSEVLSVPEDAIEPTPPMVVMVNLNFIVGIAKVENKLIILLDLGSVLSENEKRQVYHLMTISG